MSPAAHKHALLAQGQRLTRLMDAQGVTPIELAHAIGLQPKTVRRWLTGQSDMAWLSAVQAAEYLGVSLDYLAGMGSAEVAA